ncbi:DUF922 domain-containing protein [Sphingomonas sp. MMS24-J45]|uniref:DUF922 domain-containing protein n=1 Tax=Sphingomonas sp. MMS24-J45 TaxID=3238806 RepID=UPI00384B0927
MPRADHDLAQHVAETPGQAHEHEQQEITEAHDEVSAGGTAAWLGGKHRRVQCALLCIVEKPRYRFLVTILLFLAAVPAEPVSTPPEDTAKIEVPFASLPNVTITYYDVTGRDAASVRRSIDAMRPSDPNDKRPVDGLSNIQFRWRWRSDAKGVCTASPDDVTFSATVTVPRLVGDRISADLRRRFDRYLQSLLAHEDGHVRYAWIHRDEIATAINTASCATANAAAQAALQKINAYNIAFDKTTRHGATTILPLE